MCPVCFSALLTVFLFVCPVCFSALLTVFLFVARAFISGAFQGAYIYTPEVSSVCVHITGKPVWVVFVVSIIQQTLTWTTRSLRCVFDFFAGIYVYMLHHFGGYAPQKKEDMSNQTGKQFLFYPIIIKVFFGHFFPVDAFLFFFSGKRGLPPKFTCCVLS